MVLVIYKTLRPNLRVYFVIWVFFFNIILFWYHFSIYRLMSNGGKEQHQKICLFLSECGTFSGRRQSFHLVPKITKRPIQEISLVG